jgi:hypothetical protein
MSYAVFLVVGVSSLIAKVSEHSICCTYPPMKMEQIERSEKVAFKLQTPGNHSEESKRHDMCYLQ